QSVLPTFPTRRSSDLIVVPPVILTETFDFDTGFVEHLKEYSQLLSPHLYLAATRSYLGDDQKKLYQLAQLSEKLGIPMVATNDVDRKSTRLNSSHVKN